MSECIKFDDIKKCKNDGLNIYQGFRNKKKVWLHVANDGQVCQFNAKPTFFTLKKGLFGRKKKVFDEELNECLNCGCAIKYELQLAWDDSWYSWVHIDGTNYCNITAEPYGKDSA